jgi:hypothetical protein
MVSVDAHSLWAGNGCGGGRGGCRWRTGGEHGSVVGGAVPFMAKVGVDEVVGIGGIELAFEAEDVILWIVGVVVEGTEECR